MQDYIEIEDLKIPLSLVRGKRKTLAISITPEAGLLVQAPLSMKEAEIERFLRQRRYWIYKQTKRALAEKKCRVERTPEEIGLLKEKARKRLLEKTEYYKTVIGVDYKKLRIGSQKTRWGSFSSSGTISYNWKLILMPEEIMDYVVVHELCHILEMNHSRAFWEQVGRVLPDYRDRRKWLKENGMKF